MLVNFVLTPALLLSIASALCGLLVVLIRSSFKTGQLMGKAVATLEVISTQLSTGVKRMDGFDEDLDKMKSDLSKLSTRTGYLEGANHNK